MCGIWAMFGSEGNVLAQCSYAYKIKHRGPDAFRIETVNSFPNSCIAFHWLSIMGDIRSMQPMRISKYPSICLMYNGDIYNYRDLGEKSGFLYETESDGESIIHLYAQGGIEFVTKHLDGVFAFCLIDTQTRKVFLGRDTFGVKPAFRIANDKGFLALSSEAKWLVGLSYGDGHTQVKPLLPGHVETYEIDENGKAYLTQHSQFHTVGGLAVYRKFPAGIAGKACEFRAAIS